MRHAPFVLPATLVLAACATPAPSPEPAPAPLAGAAVVTVTAFYRERILLPSGHVLTVRVEDVSLADAPARVMVQAREPIVGAPPYRVVLAFSGAEVDPAHTYAVGAEIRDPSGAPVFVTDTRHAVLTQGAPASADILLKAAR
ncbi:YbaY family lipoprotein [Brevundimonas sp. SORGH_AS_0993]|uniref:YbaY family lipoprotein n=1 Tax=Brevundimonas sp. SORGH_AS_0993 TaxID=3041794 RepID=UPI002783729C|nr:YbaY family lipoprotein [Brevundimonas sp. SORGH_AS_0993]MDQ1153587.1 putative lipoprotein [Brevundimonas sp. SORGH_AS_0993]